jgi:predicted nucleic acid-binding protein
VIVLDTSGVLAALDASAKQHEAARKVIEESEWPLLLSPFVLAELDYLCSTRFGYRTMVPVLRDVADGAYMLVSFGVEEMAAARDVAERYVDQEIGLADASLVVIAARYRTTSLLTLDERHFRVIRPLWGDAFTLLPADPADTPTPAVPAASLRRSRTYRRGLASQPPG